VTHASRVCVDERILVIDDPAAVIGESAVVYGHVLIRHPRLLDLDRPGRTPSSAAITCGIQGSRVRDEQTHRCSQVPPVAILPSQSRISRGTSMNNINLTASSKSPVTPRIRRDKGLHPESAE
jgi:hypothetical protein